MGSLEPDRFVVAVACWLFPMVDNGRLVGCVRSSGCRATAGSSTAVAEIMQACSEATAAIGPHTDAMEVLLLMTRTQNSRLIVSEPDRVLGAVTLMTC